VVAKANNLDLEIVETATGENAPADYLKINKLGKIPTFVGSDGYILTEAIAIAIYGQSFRSPLGARSIS
jgi:elongation factor 1-gamma